MLNSRCGQKSRQYEEAQRDGPQTAFKRKRESKEEEMATVVKMLLTATNSRKNGCRMHDIAGF